MINTGGLGKLLWMSGLVLLAMGALLSLGSRLPWLGRLPGDFVLGGENWRIYVPLGSSLVVSVIVTLILALFSRR